MGTSDAVADTILDVAAAVLASEGFDGLQLRDVAREAKVSLNTVYKHFPSRDVLVVASVEHWMATQVYSSGLAVQAGESMAGHLTRTFRQIFESWRHNLTMLQTFLRAAVLPGGERLGQQSAEALGGSLADAFEGSDPELVADLELVLPNLVTGLLTRFASGEIDVDEIVRVYERAVRRLTGEERNHGTTD